MAEITSALFKIGVNDYTGYIPVPNYKVNNFPIYDEWEDGNSKKHRYILRHQIKGTFTLKFDTADHFKAFNTLVNQNIVQIGDNAGAVLCSIYVTNEDRVASAYLYLDYDPENTMPFMGYKNYEGFQVEVMEV